MSFYKTFEMLILSCLSSQRIYYTHRENKQALPTCGLYYKPMMIINDYSRVINKLEVSLTDDASVVIYDHHMFIVQATGHCMY